MRVTRAKPLAHFHLELSFDNGDFGVVDLSSYAGRGVFADWNVPGLFEQVQVTAESAVEWPGDIDLCPDALYLQLIAVNRHPCDSLPHEQ